MQNIIKICGVIAITLGLTVIYGWHTHNIGLIRILPSFSPMQYNTAIGFFMSGITALLINNKKQNTTFYCICILTILLGFLTILQYTLEVDFGIDRLFDKHTISAHTHLTGRMGLNTSLCFMLWGAFALSYLHQKNKVLYSSLVALILSISTVSLFGYISGVESAHGWGYVKGMALHTSLGFVLLSFGGLFECWNRDKIGLKLPYWSPITLFIGGVTTSMILLVAIHTQRYDDFYKALQNSNQLTSTTLSMFLDKKLQAIERFAYRTKLLANKDNLEIINEDAEYYFKTYQSLESLAIFDQSNKIILKWGKSHQFSLPPEQISITSNKLHFLIPCSIGNVYAIFNLPTLFENFFSKDINKGNYQVIYKNQLIYGKRKLKQVLPQAFNLRNLHINIYVSKQLQTSYLETTLALLGILLSIIASMFLNYWLKLKVSEHRFRHLFSNASVAIATFSPNGTISSVNNAFLLLFQCKTPPKHLKQIFQTCPSLPIAESKIDLSGIRNSVSFPLTAKFSHVIHNDYVVFIIDNTETQNAFDLIERSNQSLEQFAFAASHDLQEPLRKISGFSRRLKKSFTTVLDEDAVQSFDIIIDSCSRMSKLIKSLLSLSQVNSVLITPTSCDLNKLLIQICNDMDLKYKDQAKQVYWNKLPTIVTDSIQLSRLLQNLISNGLKYNHSENPCIIIEVNDLNDEWLFTVTDNGIGIPIKFKDKIFEVFQRLHSKTEYEGVGIGLHICQKIASRLGGKIWLESSTTGATFKFTIKKVL